MLCALCADLCFFFQAEDGIRDLVRSRGLGDVYKRQDVHRAGASWGPAWQAVGEAKRWEPAPGDKMTRALEALMHEPVSYTHLTLPTSDLV